MDNTPLISVIIPTHNRPDFLKKTLQSILSQTLTQIEIIVVSNGVNDKNRQTVESFNDPRLFYVDQENSGGPSSPRNHGIRLSKGKYIAFCDDDDLWVKDKLEKQVEVLENNPEYGLSYSKMMRFDDKKEWSVAHEEGPADLNSLLRNNTVPISSVIVKKELLEKYGSFSESKLVGTAEDYEFLLRLAPATKFFFLNEYLIHYWSGNNRITTALPSAKEILIHRKYLLGSYFLAWTHTRFALSKLIVPLGLMVQSTAKSLLYLAYMRFRKTFGW
ncbi:MAG: glycosyltransferase family 2 protein [Candidatus Paracaedibacteraceae bacterium]|nr:glycosyltransferase family 2 protein [Candidatus Paracaedibacteraceae bacterium]